MRLISLNLENFRQHKATEIHFPLGLIGILGANGSGKTTILEAIAWALYGNQSGVTRGDLESLIWRMAPGKSQAVAELTFSFNGQTIKVRRSQSSSKSNAELSQNGKIVANSTKAVNEKLSELLGMTHVEFFNSYFTGQKDLNFLGSIKGATERERFIAKMLGYERITEVQGASNKEGTIRFDLRLQEKKVDRLEGGLGSLEAINTEIANYQTQLTAAEVQFQAANQALSLAIAEKQVMEPQVLALEQNRDRHHQLRSQQQTDQTQLDRLQLQIHQKTQGRSQLAMAAERHEALKLEVAKYGEMEAQVKALDRLRQDALRKSDLELRLAQLQTEVNQLATDQALGDVQSQLEQVQAAIAQIQTQLQLEQSNIQALTQAWQANQADLKAKISNEHQNLKKLELQQQTIITAGAEGSCPTCERPLHAEYEYVVAGFTDQQSHGQSLIQAWQQELEAIALPPADLTNAQQQSKQTAQLLQTNQKTEIKLVSDRTKQQLLQTQYTAKESELTSIMVQIATIPTGFNPALYDRLSQQVQTLKPKYEEYLRCANAPQRLEEIDLELAALQLEQTQTMTAIAKIDADICSLNFNEADYQSLKQAIALSTNQIETTRTQQNQAQQQVALINQSLTLARTKETEFHLKSQEYQIAKSQQALLQEVDQAFTEMRQYFTEQIRPQLAEAASIFLNQLTDGRYNLLEIDPKYNVLVFDNGDRKPVISGGEEDIVNLCLRLAISQMITERSGQPFSLLILDEVFGSLDDGRRDNVLSLLNGLEQQFEQVLIISHLESIKESLNHSIRLEFDPDQQCSRIVNEN